MKMLHQTNSRNILHNTLLIAVVMVNLVCLIQITYGAATHGNMKEHGHNPSSHVEKHLEERKKHPANKILGSKKEVETFEQMPPEVAKARLRELASKMDKNVDGKIEKKELQVSNTVIQNVQSYLSSV